MARNPRGVFEKVKGSGVWWIRYGDTDGRLRREKAGTKAVAIKLYRKRKQEASKAGSCRRTSGLRRPRSQNCSMLPSHTANATRRKEGRSATNADLS
jgi:hypothetical protein